MAIPLGFLTFSRANEREADHLGLQYMYKAGYDPTAFVDFFEKIESLEKRKPGTLAKVFSTHPMTDDRIKAAQDEIQKDLAPKPEYVVNTSEFNDVKARLAMCTASASLRTIPTRAGPLCAGLRATALARWTKTVTGRPTDQDHRPTLKRRDRRLNRLPVAARIWTPYCFLPALDGGTIPFSRI